ncbi:MAG: hypothetical protein K0Q72_4358, partial [Armatimonadetes bacterium]|nr:hypothetical protein [Armatimonadota bacterium]
MNRKQWIVAAGALGVGLLVTSGCEQSASMDDRLREGGSRVAEPRVRRDVDPPKWPAGSTADTGSRPLKTGPGGGGPVDLNETP